MLKIAFSIQDCAYIYIYIYHTYIYIYIFGIDVENLDFEVGQFASEIEIGVENLDFEVDQLGFEIEELDVRSKTH